MIFYGRCCVCEQDGEWPTAEQRSTWFDYHWAQTGHDDEFTIDRPHVHIPGLRQARYTGRCGTCRTIFGPGHLIAPLGMGWECKPCAVSRHSTKQREEQGK